MLMGTVEGLLGEWGKVFFQTTTNDKKLNKVVRNSHLKMEESDEKVCNNL